MSYLTEPVKLVTIESPYSEDIEKHVEYLLECMHDSYMHRKEAPIASHLLYTRLPKKILKEGDDVYQGHVTDVTIDSVNVDIDSSAVKDEVEGVLSGSDANGVNDKVDTSTATSEAARNRVARHGRMHGIRCGFSWNRHADICAVYTDHGISKGMAYGIQQALMTGTKVEYRTIYDNSAK